MCFPGPTSTLAGDENKPSEVSAPKTDDSDALRLFQLTQRWLNEGGVPIQSPEPIMTRDAIGVAVTLRTRGIVVGYGQSLDITRIEENPTSDEPVDLIPHLRLACEQAFSEVREELAAINAGRESQGLPKGNRLEPATLIDASESILIDVQIACHLQPILLNRQDDLKELFASFATHADGLVLHDPASTRTEPNLATLWPSQIVSQNLTPNRQFNILLSDVGLPLIAVEHLAQPNQPLLYRFEVRHVVRPTVDAKPIALQRGHRIITQHFMQRDSVERLIDRMGQHLVSRLRPQGQFTGTYLPATFSFEPAIAPIQEQAIAAYALMRFAQYQFDQEEPTEEMTFRVDRLIELVESFGQHIVEPINAPVYEDIAYDPNRPLANTATLALCVLTLDADPLGRHDPELLDKMTQALVTRTQHPDWVNQPTPVRAVAAAALAKRYERLLRLDDAKAAMDTAMSLWTAQAEPDIHAAPWITRAHFSLRSLADHEDFSQSYQQWTERQYQLLEKALEQQVIETPLLGPDDVKGGYELRPGPANAPPNPDWRTAPMLSLLSYSLRHDTIRQRGDELGYLLSAGLAARFIDQLTYTQPGTFYHRIPARSFGGMRLAMWDQRVGLAAHSLGVVSLLDLLDTLDALRQ